MPDLPVVHGCTHLRPLGGVQSMLRRHLRQDGALGLNSSGVLWFEQGPFEPLAAGRPVIGLGLRWFSSGRTLRRRLRRLTRTGFGADAVWAFHDLWGLPTLGDLDPSHRRIGVLHSHWNGADDLLRASGHLLDGMLCVSDTTVQLARACLPTLDPSRIVWLPYPVEPPPMDMPARSASRAEIVIGYCGRIQRVQKRVERIPVFARELRAAGVAHRWEILGEGPDRPLLERELAAAGVSARFHGVQSGAAYWQALAAWDLIAFTSDFEGLPIAMLESMHCGVIPVFPDVDCGGRDYARRVSPELVYRAGDLTAGARTVAWYQSQTEDARARLRQKSIQAVGPHRNDAYGRTFASFSTAVANLPRVSMTGQPARRPHPGEYFPFGFLGRLPITHRLRKGCL